MEKNQEKTYDYADYHGGIREDGFGGFDKGVQMDKAVHEKTQELIALIKVCSEYTAYVEQLQRVKQVPGLKEQIDNFRRQNFALQSSNDYSFEKIEAFEREYEKFRENPLVSDFLSAELAFCRMMQSITIQITDAVEFE